MWREQYLLFPNAVDKLKKAGMDERIADFKKIHPYSRLELEHYTWNIKDVVDDLNEKGYYIHIPSDFKQKYFTTMNSLCKNINKYHWVFFDSEGEKKIPATPEDIDLFTGSLASLVFSSEEMWDFKNFGFTSASEFIATVGIYLLNKGDYSKSPLKEGYTWSSKRKNKSIINCEITGDSNGDLRVFQQDVSTYPVVDLFGNNVEFIPSSNTSAGTILGYHSTEPHLLRIVLKYIDQQKINVDFMKDNAKELINWAESISPEKLVAAAPFGHRFNHIIDFNSYVLPLPVLDKNNSTNSRCFDFIGCSSDKTYLAYISHDGDLVFSYSSFDNNIKNISARFSPDDAEHLVKGLLYQSIKGLGRTSSKELIGILEYRFSSEFKNDLEKQKKEYGLK